MFNFYNGYMVNNHNIGGYGWGWQGVYVARLECGPGYLISGGLDTTACLPDNNWQFNMYALFYVNIEPSR